MIYKLYYCKRFNHKFYIKCCFNLIVITFKVTKMNQFLENPVLESVNYITEQSTHVRISKEGVANLAAQIKKQRLVSWWEESSFDISKLENLEKQLAFLVIFNSVSFSYWPEHGKEKWVVNYKGKKHNRGTFSMIASLERAVDARIPLLNPEYLSEIKKSELEKILRGNSRVPLLEERWNILREMGCKVMDKFDGKFIHLIEEANRSALGLTYLLVNEFPSFDDHSIYNSKEVFFYKRAQLASSDIGQLIGMEDIEKLTGCADYINPMVLEYKGALVYSTTLKEKINSKVIIEKGSKEANEIRGGTLKAIRDITEILKAEIPGITDMKVNDFIWVARKYVPSEIEYHLTRTLDY